MRKGMAVLLALLCAMLCACSSFVPSDYTVISEHREGGAYQPQVDALSAQSYAELKRAIRSLVQNRQTEGTIRVSGYTDGVIEEDAAQAAYEVAREDPLGAYAVDYMTHDCVQIVSYYEVHVAITYREAAADADAIAYGNTLQDVSSVIQKAMDEYQPRATWYSLNGVQYDYSAIVDDYYAANEDRLMAKPELRVSEYPENGTPQIVELTLSYPASPQQLTEMAQAVTDSLRAASVYVRYRSQEKEKAELLYTYLSERFTYQQVKTGTPIYSALCEGAATSDSMAASWQLLCREAGLNCQTVTGIHKGENYRWNIVCLDGEYFHVDVLRNLLNNEPLQLYYDEDLTDYYWDLDDYPSCQAPEEEDAEEELPDQTGEELPNPPDELPEETPSEQQPEERGPQSSGPEKNQSNS